MMYLQLTENRPLMSQDDDWPAMTLRIFQSKDGLADLMSLGAYSACPMLLSLYGKHDWLASIC
uniref:Uncharacterized protein n=1 Tax=Arundo donax TaxID=35708 RepID=A0A0A9AXQ2_ARUDO